ncbi:zinc-binding dehydrogenase [Nocardia sp. NBC_00565]|uniref:zinc-binding dehydrogenase n=1 Tax=Nocardia sp. NBC_00565 TaxID=2975993 RepID=UPI002E817AFB|nr:zinc-binding dehydrogenase [Nocardia sp. NBC_00565]WUC07896.1 zinc-binding dehydrogenase [Nocardia sp. NBC_00565]
MTVHRNAVAVIPEDVPFATASILGCAVTTGLGAVFRSARVQPGSTVAVIGTGGVGMMAIQGARIAGASKVIAIDVVPAKLAAALRFGATDVVDARDGDPVAHVRDLTAAGVDFSFEAVGRAATAAQAFSMLAPAGVATVIGMIPDATPIEIRGSELFLQEKKLQGSFMGSNQFKVDIPRYVDLYRQGRLMLDEMISEQLDLTDINKGFDILKAGAAARVVVAMGRTR